MHVCLRTLLAAGRRVGLPPDHPLRLPAAATLNIMPRWNRAHGAAQLTDNGYVMAKMERVRLLHLHLLASAGGGPGLPAAAHACKLHALGIPA